MRQIALVSESELIPAGDVSKVAAAIQKQATRDLAPIWEISATVDAFATLEDVPVGYWAVIIRDDIQDASAAGIHEDENGQPFALVTASADINVWSITASHEALEMLVDPSGNRLVAADSKQLGKRVSYLVEVCDPSEATEHAYSCNGILVSDFYTPNYFDPVKAAGVRYSFTGAISEPLQVLAGGYLSWQDPSLSTWQQETWFSGSQPTIVDLGPIDQKTNGNVRAVIDRLTMPKTIRTLSSGRRGAMAAGLTPEQNGRATFAHARSLRAQINRIFGRPSPSLRPIPAVRPKVPDVAAAAVGAAPQPAGAFDSQKATLLGEFIGAAYAMFTANPGVLQPPPSSGFPAGWRLAASVQMQDFVFSGTGPVFYGFVAQSLATPSQYVLAIRGTSDWEEWWDDLHAISLTEFRVPGCGSVGDGFAKIYDTIQLVEYPSPPVAAFAAAPRVEPLPGKLSEQIARLVQRRTPAMGSAEAFPATATVEVTGHSLGSALATLYVMENAKTDQIHNPLVCTFASPLVGDPTFAAAFNGLGLTSWRIANDADLVCYVPPPPFFAHVDRLVAVSGLSKALPTPPCQHALETYLSLIDSSHQPSAACKLPFAALQAAQARGPARAPVGEAFAEAIAISAEAAPAAATLDGQAISNLVAIASNPQALQAAQATAAQRLLAYDGEKYPQDGCAVTLSVLLQQSGINVPDTYMAIDMCRLLQTRGWRRIALEEQQKGDVGTTCGEVPNHGTDHVYVVLRSLNPDEMVVADNQEPVPHFRFASGKGKSPTTYFLRAPTASA
jgi:Lipase (class 3)